ncbi:MAG: DUF2281 domain-containing protein [Gammaproteobacteria bacterium]|nr:DUF2281 domain-containing protein [Gammaproteobacteria bacterium]MBU1979797.1 DUF2281 domain-containing protein [Gammaproteobacteria bacterium]
MKLEQTIQQHVEKLPLPLQGEVLDYVLYLEQKARQHSTDDRQRRMKLASTLELLVTLNPFAKIDPAAWERKHRQDRPLPGRE